MTPAPTIAFDLDGTLIDSAPDLHAAANRMLSEAGPGAGRVRLDQVRGFIGNGIPMLVLRTMRAAGLGEDPDTHRHLTKVFSDHYAADPVALTTLYPGVRAALDALVASGCRLTICTNKPRAPALAVLRAFDLSDLFDTVIGGDSLPTRKPDPQMLHAALDPSPRGGAVFVGDSEVDAKTAQRAKVPFLLFTGGYRRGEINTMPRAATFDNHDQLATLAHSLFGEDGQPSTI